MIWRQYGNKQKNFNYFYDTTGFCCSFIKKHLSRTFAFHSAFYCETFFIDFRFYFLPDVRNNSFANIENIKSDLVGHVKGHVEGHDGFALDNNIYTVYVL